MTVFLKELYNFWIFFLGRNELGDQTVTVVAATEDLGTVLLEPFEEVSNEENTTVQAVEVLFSYILSIFEIIFTKKWIWENFDVFKCKV